MQYGSIVRAVCCRDEGRLGLVVWERWGGSRWMSVYYQCEDGWELQSQHVLFEPFYGPFAHVL